MSGSEKSKAFSELVLSMSGAERIAMAIDLLTAIEPNESVRPKLHTATEAKRVAKAIFEMAHEIEVHHPGGTGW